MSRFTQLFSGRTQLENYYEYTKHPSLSLERALAPAFDYIDQLEGLIKLAKSSRRISATFKLTEDESAAIYLYTIEQGEQSVHVILNRVVYLGNYSLMKPWFGFLNLFHSALAKLPPVTGVIWGGIVADLVQYLQDNDEITWSSFSSCSFSCTMIRSLLDESSVLCSINAVNGKSIRDFAYNSSQNEVLLLPGTRLRVKSKKIDRPTNKLILTLDEISDSKPTISTSTTKLSSSNDSRQNDSKTDAAMNNHASQRNESRKDINYSTTTFSNGDCYEVPYINGKKQGFGKLYDCSGKIYEGSRGELRVAGVGTRTYSNGDRYKGNFLRGEMSGFGTYRRADGYVYEGNWIADEPYGEGCSTWPNGNRYEGWHEKGKIEGWGTFFASNGDAYHGNFVDGKAHGQGVRTWVNGDRYEGDFRGDKKHGYGKYLYANKSEYEGYWANDEIHGDGFLKWASGTHYRGAFQNGKRHGQGKLTFANGYVQEGRWENDKYKS